MAFAPADLATIQAAIATGVMRVRFADGREVTYQSADALLAAEKRIASGLASAAGGRRRARTPAYRNGC